MRTLGVSTQLGEIDDKKSGVIGFAVNDAMNVTSFNFYIQT